MRALRKYLGEGAVVVALVSGWALLTWGLDELLGPVVWKVSGGVFLLSLCGWRLLLRIFGDGLYHLMQGGKS